MNRLLFVVIALCSLQSIVARESFVEDLARVAKHSMSPGIVAVPPAGTTEVGFSPDAGAEYLVLKTINSAKKSIRVMAYSFTSAPIVRALLAAKHRGVDVQLVADQKSNTGEDRSGKSKAALSALANAGVPVRLISAYAIHHDKILVVDNETVETGSFNYSDAAAHRNSENVMVIWGNQRLASVYLKHWQSRFDQGQPYSPY